MIRQLVARSSVTETRVTIEAGGIETGRFSNDLPEGRILSRGVEVIVERKK